MVFAQKQQIDSLQKIIRNYEKLHNYQSEIDYLNLLNNLAAHFRDMNPDSMLVIGQKCNNLCQKINYTNGSLEATRHIGLAYHLKGDDEMALIYYRIGLKIAEQTNNQEKIATFYTLIGYIYIDKGKSNMALNLYLKALKIKQNLANKNDVAKILHNISLLYLDQDDYLTALDYCLESLRVTEATGNKQHTGYVFITLAKIKARQGYDDEALSTNNKSIIILDKISNKKGVAINLADIADIYIKQGKYKEALMELSKSLAIRRKIDDKKGISYSLSSIAKTYELQKKYKDAIEIYFEALTIKQFIGDNAEMPQDLNGLAICYLGLNNHTNALDYALKALELAKKYQQKSKIRDFNKNLSSIYKAIGNDKLALAYYEQFNIYKDSISNKEIANKTAQLQANYEYEKKEGILKAVYKNQQTIQHIVIFCSLLILMCILAITFFVSRSHVKLQKAYNNLKLANIEIEHQKTTMAAQSENLIRVNTTKDKLFSIIGHDLRNPIATLKSLLALVLTDDVSQEEFKTFAPKLQRNVNTVYDTLENLLQWAYSQMQGMNHSPNTFDMQDIVTNNIALVAEIAHAKQITILQDIHANCSIFADENHINLILRNLINNALKFTNQGGNISIATKLVDTFIQVSVTDTGVGMNAEQLANLFYVDKSFTTYGTDGEKGTGLGLLLCKEMVTINGGKMWVTSKENEGTTFYFTVPCCS
jgi:signal transduction histidine kinase